MPTPSDNALASAPFLLMGWTVEPEAGQLHRDGKTLRLEPKVMGVLAYLARRQGHVVSRDELFEAVWPDVVVTESAVNRCVSRLRRVFDDDPQAARVIETIPKRGYRLLATVGPLESLGDGALAARPGLVAEVRMPEPRLAKKRTNRRWSLGLATVVAVGVLAGIMVTLGGDGVSADAARTFHPLTSLPGIERDPALAPNGRRVAFARRAPGATSYDLYAQSLGTATPVALTETAAHERFPAWSPDGEWIAFARIGAGTCSLHVISAMGTEERRLGTCTSVSGLTWSDDGDWLAYGEYDHEAHTSRIILHSPETLERRALTNPAPGTRGDFYPAFAPGGRAVAYVQGGERYGSARVVEARLSGGEPSARTPWLGEVRGLDWDAASGDLFVAAEHRGVLGLWRVGQDEHLELVNLDSVAEIRRFASAAGGLAVEAWTYDTDLVSVGDRTPFSSIILASTYADEQPALSQDGERVAFVSSRSGTPELWVGSGEELMRPVPHPIVMKGERVRAPAWSPDGAYLAFEVHTPGGVDVYVMPSRGGAPRQVTHHAAADIAPSFSHDGRWVYFGSMRSGTWQIWKVPVGGGELVQVTDAGGYRVLEAVDGLSLYVARYGTEGLWVQSADGSQPAQRVAPLGIADWGNWGVTDRGPIVLSREGGVNRLLLWEEGAEGPRELSRIEGALRGGHPSVAASRDGSVILATYLRGGESDLMLSEADAL